MSVTACWWRIFITLISLAAFCTRHTHNLACYESVISDYGGNLANSGVRLSRRAVRCMQWLRAL
jgi:hypothetical protein